MADFVVTDTHTTVTGTAGVDRLTVNWSLEYIGLPGVTPNPAGGYDGHFSTAWAGEGVYFSGIEHFTFNDLFGAASYVQTGSGDDVLNGGDGDDTLHVGSGDDSADGGAGTDLFGADQSGWAGAIALDLNGPSVLRSGTVENFEGFSDLVTGSGDDSVTGHRTSFMPDRIDTGAGDDLIRLWSNGEKDVVDGGAGEDRLIVEARTYLSLPAMSADAGGGYSGVLGTGYANEGVYFSGIEHFTFEDMAGEDNTLSFGAGDDVVLAGDGNDMVDVGRGDDSADGGPGFDFFGADLSDWTAPAVLSLNRASTLIGGTVENFEGFGDLVTGAGDDSVTGHRTSFMPDRIDTGAGTDRIRLWSNGEKDIVDGGAGSDRLTVVAHTYLSLTDLAADASGHGGTWSTGYANEGVYFSGIDHFSFTDLAAADNTIGTGGGIDVLRAGGGDDGLEGGGGSDSLFGGPGRDQLTGGDGNDRLEGGAMNDVLEGGTGRDVLIGGPGNDRLTGGDHADQFVYNIGDGSDAITDFGTGADRIVIETGAAGFANVTVAGLGGDTVLRFADVSVRLVGVDPADIDAGDFLFLA